MAGRLGDQENTLRDGLAQLRLAFVQIQAAVQAAAQTADQAADQPNSGPTEPS
jgi:hypothetical protein